MSGSTLLLRAAIEDSKANLDLGDEGTAQGPLWEQIAVTMEETVIGFIIGVVLGIFFGVLLGRSKLLSDIFSPYIKAGNAIPRVVLGSIFAIWLGLGIQSKIALAVVLVFFIVFFNAFQGVREVDRNLIANARILGASPRQLSMHVIIPSALSWIIASLHTSFSFALVGAVVGSFWVRQRARPPYLNSPEHVQRGRRLCGDGHSGRRFFDGRGPCDGPGESPNSLAT